MRAPVVRLYENEIFTDCFAGAGGASVGATAAGCEPFVAINHNKRQLALHAINHPRTKHIRSDVFEVDPRVATEGRPVGGAWFSPDCTDFSRAKGGVPNRPRSEKRRALAWVVIDWAKAVKPRVIFLENVVEFADWGPLTKKGQQNKLKRGLLFRQWWKALEDCGYKIEMRRLRACDYGAPTTRERLFIIARCDGKPIVWPTPTHGPGTGRPYRSAAECIQWEIPGASIFLSKKEAAIYRKATGQRIVRPLAWKTLRRVARGMDKFVLKAAEPFILPVTHAGDARVHGITEPVRTVTGAHRGELALAMPYVMKNMNNNVPRGVDQPLSTVLTGNHHFLTVPTMIQTGWGERSGIHGEQAPRCLDIQQPVGTLMATGNKNALVTALLARAGFISKGYGGHESPGSDLKQPLDTITCQDHNWLVASHLAKFYGTSTGSDTRAPMPTITANGRGGGHLAEVRALLRRFHGKDAEPHVRIGDDIWTIVDIYMRMLVARELYRAQGFPDDFIIDFEFEGKPFPKTAQIEGVGNSVCPPLAQALIEANLGAEAAIEVAS